MPYGESITDAELDIIKVLWKNEGITSPEIFMMMSSGGEKSVGTLKTLLARLVQKGAVRREQINERHYKYFPVITEKEYIDRNRRRLIDRMFNGSVQELLLNFVKEENITKEDLDSLFRQIEEQE